MQMKSRLAIQAGILGATLLLSGLAATARPAGAATTAGTLDPTFGSGGKVLTNLGVEALPSDALVQSNGDIVVSGNFGLARFLPNGTLDTAFGHGGVAATGFTDNGLGPAALIQEPAGGFIWAANTATAAGTAFAVARFTATGSLDQSFGTGGMVTTEFFAPPLQGALEVAKAVLLQPDGKILVGGTARQGQNRFAPTQGALARYNLRQRRQAPLDQSQRRPGLGPRRGG